MKTIKKMVERQHIQNILLENNKQEIEQSNQKLTLSILIMGCIAFFCFIFFSLIVTSYNKLTEAYLIEAVILCTILLFFNYLKKRIPSAFLIYIGYATLVGYAIYTSAFITPEFTSVIILFFLFQLPIVTIDKSWRVNLIVSCYAIIYMIIVIPFKDGILISDEILNCLLFTLFGIGIGATLRAARLENFELKRQSLIREKIDYLTGLNNRKSLFEKLIQIESTADTKPLALMMIDIDYFKQYNDTYGHLCGDDCLKRICQCFIYFGLTHNISFYRYGGEEFVGIIIGDNTDEAVLLGQKINTAIHNLQIPHINSEYNVVTVSIGISSITNKQKKLLLSQADIALYNAKTQGRNRTVIYHDNMNLNTPLKKASYRTRT